MGTSTLHLKALLNILMPRYELAHLIAKCHEVTQMMKLLISGVTKHMPQNRVSDPITHVSLNTINDVH
jgi:hypothetical protein